MNFDFEMAALAVAQISILAFLGKRFRMRFSKGKIEFSWERKT